jgi:hypothetical protein
MTSALKNATKDPIRNNALKKLIAATPLDYKPKALATVDIGYGGVGQGHTECTTDGQTAVSAAILYWATGTVGYATLAASILKAWATTNTVWRGDNAILEASWSVCSMARAAELLKYSDGPGKSAWAPVEAAFFAWLDKVINPVLRSEVIWGWPIVGNWHFSQICARMQVAILREDAVDWSWCIKKYPEALNKTFVNKHCVGETAEVCRDQTHSCFLIGGAIQAPEMTLHQGVNLFDDRLSVAFELQAAMMMKEIPEGFTADDIHTPYGYWPEPVFEIAYNHFVIRKKKSMPKLTTLLATNTNARPDRATFHWGPNTLTHYGQG